MRDCLNLTNLIIFVYCFVTASFNYYLITFNMKYIPGDVFINTVVSSLAEAVATFLSAPLQKMMGPRNSLTVMFALCGISGVFLAIAESNESWVKEIPPIILFAKFGISAAFAFLYMSTAYYFDSKFMGTIFGICNLVCRAATILSPMVAEAEFPVPVISLVITCLIATILSRCLREPRKNTDM
jgi:MFS family permease